MMNEEQVKKILSSAIIVKSNGVVIKGKLYPQVRGVSEEPQDKIVSGQAILGRKAVRIYVERKLDETELTPEDLIPKTIKLEDGTEAETDVVEIGYVTALE